MLVFKKDEIEKIAAFVKEGKVIIFPTETSYGMGCDAANQSAVDKIFQIKARAPGKPLLVVAPSATVAKKYLIWNGMLETIAKKYWPGALTVVGKYRRPWFFGKLARGVVGADGTVAVRVTADAWLKNFCEKLNKPLVATSANLAGKGNLYDPHAIEKQFSGLAVVPDGIVDGGSLPVRPSSTVVSVIENQIQVLRQGEVKL